MKNDTNTPNSMKTPRILCPLIALLWAVTAVGQLQPQSGGRRGPVQGIGPGQEQVESTNLTKFNLDFPGGTPRQLIAAIEKSMGKPVNAVIPTEHADVKLPPLKMANVDVGQLFRTLELMSQKTESFITSMFQAGNPSYSQIMTSFGFRSQGGSLSDDTIWYFYVVDVPKTPFDASPRVSKICRFYPLTSYLERGLTVDDITTAIQTGWKMLGDKETPAISFHKETKLLIAVGEPAKLETIDAVLKALSSTPPLLSGGTFTDQINSLMQRAGVGVPPTQLPPQAPPVLLPEPPERRLPPRTLRLPETSSTNN
jgi:hypothetical protein